MAVLALVKLYVLFKDDRPGNLGVLAMQGFSLPLNVDKTCKELVINIKEECVLQVFYEISIIRIISVIYN